MSRFMLVVPPLAGHVNPAAALGHTLAARGHEVAWVSAESFIRPAVGADATVYGTGTRLYRSQTERGVAGLKSLWEEFVVPCARFTLRAVDKAAADYQPDVIVADQFALAGAIVARRYGLRWASLAASSLELIRPYRRLPHVDAWIRGQRAAVCAEAGLPEDEAFDPGFSPYLVLACTTAALTGTMAFGDQVALVGPMLDSGRRSPSFPWERLDPDRQHVAVTMGTLAGHLTQDFHRAAVDALRPLGDRLQAIVMAPAAAVPDPPSHIIVVPEAPLLALMPDLDAVICHGGLNTVSEALAHGVPLVIAPIRHDQPVNAALVVAAGAGVRVPFARARAERLRAALVTVLDDPAYARAARRAGDSFAAAGGAQAAAERLAILAAPVSKGSPSQ